MPQCHLTREFLKSLDGQHLDRVVHYSDKELPGFMLQQRPGNSGTWYFRYRNSEGKIRYCRLGASTLDVLEARAMAYTLYKKFQEGLDPQSIHRTPEMELTMTNFAHRYYLPHAKLNKRSWRLDEGMLRTRILPVFGERRLTTIRRLDVVNWLNGMRQRGLCPASCNRTLALLRFLFNCAIRWDMLSAGSSPCAGVHAFEDNSARERYLSEDEASALVQELDALSTSTAQAIKLLLFTGARKSEILNARWEYVDFKHRLLTVPLSKSGKKRHIPLSDESMNILHKLPRTESPWLFPNPRTGRPLRSIFHSWDTLRQRLNMGDVRLHDLRHSFASFLVNSGCSLYEVQKILGHYDPKVTMRYAHLASESLVRAANKAGKAVLGDKPKGRKGGRV